ncbi:DUF2735 domain-containing protein [Aureimonas psammosilenae]|uniref:DUF2735 domain-containing protein n=1 Tax=Aureimonas psammosilenae TaxID=2495496 RepID=UPI001260E40F|nr:DUF2735 domain-containing protein [Aureimonas psammosilenae]
MNLTHSNRSATIHQFPRGGRLSRTRSMSLTPVAAVAPVAPHIAEGGWYHEDAIREEAEAASRNPNKRN